MAQKQVILIMTDTQRKDMIDGYGGENMHTPNLDSLIRNGIRFDNAQTTQPVCGPARSAIFTGTYPHSNGSWGNCMPLYPNIKHIGQRLSAHGIHSAYIGKWHLDGGDYFGYGICPEGFDPQYWYDMRNYLSELTPQERVKSRKCSATREGITEDFTFGLRCANRAIDFLQKNHGESFFLTLSFDEPHGPCLCPKEFLNLHLHHKFKKSENVFAPLTNKPEHQKLWADMFDFSNNPDLLFPEFFGCNSFVDYEIGRVLNTIRKLCPDALILYTADHGDMLGSHCLNSKGAAMYKEILNIPLIVSQRSLPRGVANSTPVSHVDILPTLLEYYGIPLPYGLDGHSILSLLQENKQCQRRVFAEFTRYEIDHDAFLGFQPIRCIYDGNYKLVINLLDTDEFYDLRSDPEEMINRIDDPAYESVRKELLQALVDEMYRTRDPFRGYQWEDRPWHKSEHKNFVLYKMSRQRLDEDMPRQLDYETGLELTDSVVRRFQ